MAMTLEQVRDRLREEVAILDKIGSNHATIHRGYMQAWAYAIDAHLTQPAQAVDVGAIREVIDDLREWGKTDKQLAERAETLTRALAGEKAEGWRAPDGCIPVPRSLVERWANVDAFSAPVGAAMELRTIAGEMLLYADVCAFPTPPTDREG